MYAIIKTGGRQYQVQPESVISVNRLALEQGAAFETDQVLLLDGEGAEVHVGRPLVDGALVKGTVLAHERGRKVLIFKHKRRKNYRRTRGHRQELTRVQIESIELGGKVLAAMAPKPPKPARVRKPAEAAPAAEEAAAPAKSRAKPAAKAAAKPTPRAPAKAAAKAKAAPRKPAAKAARKAAAPKKAPAKRTAPAKSGGKGAGKGKAKKD
jgi:large subunit ribosomal protein L21